MSAGAQTIRDVLIRIGLQTSTSGFSSPDFKKVEREANDATAAVNKLNAAMSGRRVGGGGGGGAGGASSQRAPDMFAGLDIGVNKYKDVIARQRQFNDQILAADEKQLRRSDSLRQHYQALEQQNRKLVESDKQALEISNQRAEATAQLANAGLKLARGIAFVTAANEAEYQSTLKLIAQAQGYFDIATGIIDAYKSYITFSKAATAAKTAEAAATNLLAASESRAAVARMAGMGRNALGLAGRAGGALAIAAGVGLAGRLLIRDAYGLGTRERVNQQYQDRIDAYNSPEAAAARNAAGTARMNQFDSMISGRLEGGSAIRDALSNRPRGLDFRANLAGIERDRAISTQMVGSADFRGSPEQWSSEKLSRQAKIAEINLNSEKEKQEVYRKQQEYLERQLEISLSMKQATVETLRAEENRYRSLESSLGRMSAGEANRLKSIGDKLQKGGQLSRSEAEFLDRTGIGTAQADSFFVQEGRKRGSGGILSAFGEDRGLNTARENLNDFATGEAGRVAREMIEELEKLNKTLEESFENQVELIRRSINATEKLGQEQANIEQRVAKIENGNQIVAGSTLNMFGLR